MSKLRYEISADLIEQVIEVLGDYQFSDGGYTNNDDVIAVLDRLEVEFAVAKELWIIRMPKPD